jgi:hypothetical protein
VNLIIKWFAFAVLWALFGGAVFVIGIDAFFAWTKADDVPSGWWILFTTGVLFNAATGAVAHVRRCHEGTNPSFNEGREAGLREAAAFITGREEWIRETLKGCGLSDRATEAEVELTQLYAAWILRLIEKGPDK